MFPVRRFHFQALLLSASLLIVDGCGGGGGIGSPHGPGNRDGFQAPDLAAALPDLAALSDLASDDLNGAGDLARSQDMSHPPDLRSIPDLAGVKVGFSSVTASRWFPELLGITFGNGRFVAVGGSGATASSTDGLSWEYAATGVSTQKLLAVAAFGTGFVATGENGVIFTSPDARAWTQRTSGTTTILQSVTASPTRAVAVGTAVVRYSNDGVTWTPGVLTGAGGSDSGLTRVAYGNGTFVALASNFVAWTSTDGITWAKHASGASAPTGLFFDGTEFLAVSGSYIGSSTDGVTWISRTPAIAPSGLEAIAAGGGAFVATGPTETFWTASTLSGFAPARTGMYQTLDAVAYGNGAFVGLTTRAVDIRSKKISRSTDGKVWSGVSDGQSRDYSGIASGAGKIVAVGTEGGATNSQAAAPMLVSANSGASFSYGPQPTSQSLNSIRFANGLFVAVGQSGYIYSSPDGVTWTSRNSSVTNPLHALAYSGSLWVAVGDFGDAYRSADGITWTYAAKITGVTQDSLYAITFAAGQFVASGTNGTVMTSPDGITWTRRTVAASVPETLLGIVYGAGLWVTGGGNQQTYTSPDAITWTVRPQTNWNYPASFLFLNNTFLVSTAGGIHTSTDGLVWGLVDPGFGRSFTAGTYVNATYYFATDNSTIVSTPDLVTFKYSSIGDNNTVTAIDSFGGKLIASTSYGTLLTATDGKTWTVSASGAAIGYGQSATNGSLFVAPASFNKLYVAETTDFVTYNQVALPMSGFGGGSNDLAYGNGKYVTGSLTASSDGTIWVPNSNGFGESIAFGDAIFVYVGSSGSISTSADGTTFTSFTGPNTRNLHRVRFGGNRFVAVGDAGTILTSPTGANGSWVVVGAGLTTLDLRNVIYSGTQWVAFGKSVVLLSADGLVWSLGSGAFPEDIGALAALPDGTVYFGGTNGLLGRMTP